MPACMDTRVCSFQVTDEFYSSHVPASVAAERAGRGGANGACLHAGHGGARRRGSAAGRFAERPGPETQGVGADAQKLPSLRGAAGQAVTGRQSLSGRFRNLPKNRGSADLCPLHVPSRMQAQGRTVLREPRRRQAGCVRRRRDDGQQAEGKSTGEHRAPHGGHRTASIAEMEHRSHG